VITRPDPGYPTGVVGSVVPLTILAVAVLLYMRHRKQQQAQQQQILNPDGLDPYKQRTPSMYGPPMTAVPFTPYVSRLLSGAEPRNPS